MRRTKKITKSKGNGTRSSTRVANGKSFNVGPVSQTAFYFNQSDVIQSTPIINSPNIKYYRRFISYI